MENAYYFLGILCYLQVFLAYYYIYIIFGIARLWKKQSTVAVSHVHSALL